MSTRPPPVSRFLPAAGLVLLVVLSGCASVPGPESPAGSADGPATTTAPAEPAGAGSTTPGTPGPSEQSEATPVPSTAPRVTVEVVDVVDGDTVKVRFRNGTRETVRLLGVDTPEVRGENAPDEFEGVPSTDEGRQCLRTAGERASAHAEATLLGETVGLGFDESEGRRGYYGRLLAYVYVDGRQFNYGLVADGYARMYDSSFVERPRYAAAERAARSAGRGLWTCATGSTSGEATGVGIAIVDVRADAEGNDNEHLTDEYVVLQNTGDARVDLSGWVLADAAGHAYRFPTGTVLEPGETVTVRTGSGTDEPGVRYWGRERAVWNNEGDTVIVRDAGGTVVTERSY